MAKLNRRNFVASVTSGLVGLAMGKHANAAPGTPPSETEEPKIKQYNPLGKTGLKTSDVIFGAGNVFSPDVVRYALDLGVNVFDTAEHYMGGQSEVMVGNGLKGVRDKAVIITKLPYWGGRPKTKQTTLDRWNSCLKKLQTDYADIGFIHMIDDLSLLKNDEVRGGFEQLKKEGKIRFTGFSTHNAKVTLKEALKPENKDFVDVILFMYNHMEGKEIEPLVKAVHQAGIATIAMKVLAGGKQGNLKSFVSKGESYPHAAISWALGNKHIDCCVLTMGSFSHVEEYVGASGKKLKRGDLAVLKKYQHLTADNYCRVSCSRCEAFCPKNVAISDVMRYAMYFEDYKHEKKAIEHYALLDAERKPLNCASCAGHCTAACPYGLQVKDKLLSTHNILTV
jgi:predicted aldo/keto reductase-like oxidoreductase